MIEVHELGKRFGDRVALAPLSLAFARETVTVLLGPSGCGKSTLLRLVVGLLQPDTGHVVIDGQIVERANLEQVRHRIGYVIQDGGLFPHMTARANITLLARYLEWPRAQIEDRLNTVVTLTRIDRRWLDQYPTTLSGGERQRVGIARALLLDPPLLLCDEPLSALDPITRVALQSELGDLFARLGKTVLWVTHDLHEAAYLAHEIVLMRAGHVVQRGTIAELLERPADPFVSLFINAQRGQLPAAATA
ncbi:MAG: ATP-binding cassette domain-containing protein [Proteobacteria bacterium]|nr:ATP-binding cassette domain-containing protein [Burkholderiales bacterium]